MTDVDVQNGLIEDFIKTNTTATDEIIEKVKKINTELSGQIVADDVSRGISWTPTRTVNSKTIIIKRTQPT